MKINAGLSTREIETRNLIGKSWDTIILQNAEEVNKINELGIQVSTDDSADVFSTLEDTEDNGETEDA